MVSNAKRLRSAGSGEITIDSAAEESVCPKAWGAVYPMKEPQRQLQFTNASGGRVQHYGERQKTFKTGEDETVIGVTFQASDVQKPLAAVWRIAEKDNLVCFGPRAEDNYIQNAVTGKRIQIVRKGGSCVVKADFVTEEGFDRPATKTM